MPDEGDDMIHLPPRKTPIQDEDDLDEDGDLVIEPSTIDASQSQPKPYWTLSGQFPLTEVIIRVDDGVEENVSVSVYYSMPGSADVEDECFGFETPIATARTLARLFKECDSAYFDADDSQLIFGCRRLPCQVEYPGERKRTE